MTRISVELVPRAAEEVLADTATVDSLLPSVDTINIPDLMRFDLRSWEACALARGRPRERAGAQPFRAIPHIRSQDLDPARALPMLEAIDNAGIDELLVVTGDPPVDFKWRTYDVDAIEAITRLRKELPHLTVYAAVDQYRQSLTSELDYAQRKLEAGADGLFTQPFFDMRLLEAWAHLLPTDVPLWWGATTVTSPGSVTYWQRRNHVAFPRDFEPTLQWHRAFAEQVVQLGRERGDNVYLMPVRCDVASFLDGIV